MADIKWIKLSTSIFDDEKIRIIEKMPNGDAMLLNWIKLLVLAGKTNAGGHISVTPDIPYTVEMLAGIFNQSAEYMQATLDILERFGMIENDDNLIYIVNWERYQNIEGMDRVRELTRKRVANHRKRQKQLIEIATCSYCGKQATGIDHIVAISRGGTDTDDNKVPCCIDCNARKNDKPLVDFLNNNREIIDDELISSNDKLNKFVTLHNATNRYQVTPGNALDIDIDIENNTISPSPVPYSKIIETFNNICTSYAHIRLTENRKTHLKARWRQFDGDMNKFNAAFTEMETNLFLKGGNPRHWKADFDWLVKNDSNMEKVLEGKYSNAITSRNPGSVPVAAVDRLGFGGDIV